MSTDSPPPRRRAPRMFAVALVCAVLVSLAGLALSSRPRAAAVRAAEPAAVRVSPAVWSTGYDVRRESVGVVEARRESSVGFELAGAVAAVLVEEGDVVPAGALLARLDTSILDAERATLAAAREEARAASELSALTRARTRDALELDAVSAQQWDEADKDHQVRLASLARAEAALAAIDTRLARSELRAPYAARVSARHVDEGRVLAPGAPVLGLLEVGHTQARIGVARRAVDTLRVGDRHPLLVGRRRVDGVVVAVLPVLGNGTRSVDVILDLASGDDVRSGELVTLTTTRRVEEDGVWLPLTALTESSRGLWAAFVAEPVDGARADGATHVLARRELVVVHHEGERVYVRGTLADGESVVVDGLHRLVPGLSVMPRRATSALAADSVHGEDK